VPGIITQFQLLDLVLADVRQQLSQQGTPDPLLLQINKAFTDQPAYAYLGVVGPDLFDFMPNVSVAATPGTFGTGSSASAFTQIWQYVFGIAVGTTSGGTTTPGLVPTLASINGFLKQLGAIIAQRDQGKLQTLASNLGTALNDLNTLSSLVASIEQAVGPGILAQIWKGMQPLGAGLAVGSPVPPSAAWSCRDFLHGVRTGEFAGKLLSLARSSGDERFQAYAYGYAIAYTGKVCGSPFFNSAVGSTYRLNWWRARWINLFGDAWAWGYYNTTNPAPNPPPTDGSDYAPAGPLGYGAWTPLCNASLHERLTIAGAQFSGSDSDALTLMQQAANGQEASFPTALPDDFVRFWFKAFTETYGPIPAGSSFASAQMNGAYLLTWLMLWFQTSGEALGCNPTPPLAPPGSNQGDAPPGWTDPTKGLPVPAPSAKSDPNLGEIVAGAITGLLAAASALAGNVLTAGPALELAINEVLSGASAINWDDLANQLYNYRLLIYNVLDDLHKAALLIGIAHPYPSDLVPSSQIAISLVVNGTTYSVAPFLIDADHTVKSKAIGAGVNNPILGGENSVLFPAALWTAFGSTGWTQDLDTAPWEEPTTVAYTVAAYPSFWMNDGQANPLTHQNDVKSAHFTWPAGQSFPTTPTVAFGNAVDNAMDFLHAWLSNPKLVPPNWNLDADRGLGYPTWQFSPATYTVPVSIKLLA